MGMRHRGVGENYRDEGIYGEPILECLTTLTTPMTFMMSVRNHVYVFFILLYRWPFSTYFLQRTSRDMYLMVVRAIVYLYFRIVYKKIFLLFTVGCYILNVDGPATQGAL